MFLREDDLAGGCVLIGTAIALAAIALWEIAKYLIAHVQIGWR